jgi:Tfp pilus assembly major pilin PilA
MERRMKTLIKLLVVLVILAVVAVGAGLYMIDSIAKTAIEAGGSSSLGVKTSVESVSISLMGGSATVNALQINNPEGFSTPYLIQISSFGASVDTATLTSDKIVIPLVELSGLKVHIEQQGTSNNVSAIMANIKKSGGKPPAEQKPAEAGPNVVVRKIVLKNIEANVQLLPIGGKASTVPVRLDELVLTDVTENGAPIGELLARVVPAVIAGIVEKAGGAIPADLSGLLKGDIAGAVNQLGGEAAKMLQQVGGDVGKMVKDLPNLGAETGKQLQGATEGLKNATEGLKGLFGGDKKK